MNKYYRILDKILATGKTQTNKKGKHTVPSERAALADTGRPARYIRRASYRPQEAPQRVAVIYAG